MNNSNYQWFKLRDMVGHTIEIKQFRSTGYKTYDNEAHKYVFSQTPQKGYHKVFSFVVNTVHGLGYMEFSSAQVDQMIDACIDGLKCDLTNKRFDIKSNGKEGMDIRYYFNTVKANSQTPTSAQLQSQSSGSLSNTYEMFGDVEVMPSGTDDIHIEDVPW